MLLEVIHEPYRQVGTSLLVEDSRGGVIMLSLYNYVGPDEDPNELFQVGTEFALVAPYLKNAQDDRSNSLMLRCDNPQCVVMYDDDRFIWRGSSIRLQKSNPWEIRQKGNEAFKIGNLELASKCYSLGLKHPDIEVFESDKIACFGNLAEVNLRLGRWQEAMEDANKVLALEADHAKARFRLAKAMSRLGEASKALAIARELLKEGSQDRSGIQKFIHECEIIAKEEVGEYNYNALLKEARLKPPNGKLGFHGSFVSPKIAVGVSIPLASGASYRGCKAIMDLKEGELIMSSKAFAFSPKVECLSFEANVYEKSLEDERGMQLFSEIVRKLWKSPSLGTQFYLLSSGVASNNQGVEDITKIDLPKIRNIIRSNAFSEHPLDEQIRASWKKTFGGHATTLDHSFQNETPASGLWTKESMLNHSCIPNCSWSHTCDQIFIRTTKPIQMGDELCIAYSSCHNSHEERMETFRNWTKQGVGFACLCDYCNFLQKRDDLRKLAHEVDNAYEEAARAVSMQGVKMGTAADLAMSPAHRKVIFDVFADLPLRLQHTPLARLHVLEGSSLSMSDDSAGALKSYQQAAKIGYAVRGSGIWEYFLDMWRIVGSAMACNHRKLALESLVVIWNSDHFQSIQKDEAKRFFKDLTRKYSLPWWNDEYNSRREMQLDRLVREVWSLDSKKSHNKKSSKKP
ncbi:unnamed protein product [Cylindrotheca closterium]|uniref:SET domain-containing protein n=1 Tax=Cylindrotheca closterium TaxID=2856 RepID=A0AAD2CPF4_9STRA|nr:unnamed protein product [Cylindrotheca closterium]